MEGIKEVFEMFPMWIWIVIAIHIVSFIIVLVVNKKFKKFVYSLVIAAEEKIVGEKKGPERYKAVVERIHEVLPKILQIIFTQDYIHNLIERAVEKMKEELKEP